MSDEGRHGVAPASSFSLGSQVYRHCDDLALGARMALVGSPAGRMRLTLTALGVGLGVALLLLAASVPGAWESRAERALQAQVHPDHQVAAPAPDTLLVQHLNLEFRDQRVRGMLVHPEGAAAARPPGVSLLPGPGELVVSPALARLLASSGGELLRPRLGYPVVGIIADEGLTHPHDLAFYLGDNPDALATADLAGGAMRINRFGPATPPEEPLHPLLLMLLVVGLVVLLLPVAIFVAVAVRFGGEGRDRRLAALRLAGADAGMTRRIAAGEALVASLLGLASGAVFFVAGRELAPRVVVLDTSFFAADLRPGAPWLALVLGGVPALALAVTVLAMGRLVRDPLGTARRSGPARRRLWWRWGLPVAGLLLLYPMLGRETDDTAPPPYQLAAGVGLLLLGVAVLLPWLIEAVLRSQRSGGLLSWQLAARRLQMSGASAVRTINGIAVSAAGALVLLMFFGGVQEVFVAAEPSRTPGDWAVATLAGDMDDPLTASMAARFSTTTGVRAVTGVRTAYAWPEESSARRAEPIPVGVGSCAALRRLASVTGCDDGDVFVVKMDGPDLPRQLDYAYPEGPDYANAEGLAQTPSAFEVRPGDLFRFGATGDAPRWRVPAAAGTVAMVDDSLNRGRLALLATPGAGIPRGTGYVHIQIELAPGAPDVLEHVRNTAYRIDPVMQVERPWLTGEDDQFAALRRGLLIGTAATLLLIGLSLLVSTVEQMRANRRELAILAAFGVHRRTLACSVLWQTAFPMAVGLALAVAVGTGVGALLLTIVNRPVSVDIGGTLAVAAIAVAVALLTTALTLPALWRSVRADELRAE